MSLALSRPLSRSPCGAGLDARARLGGSRRFVGGPGDSVSCWRAARLPRHIRAGRRPGSRPLRSSCGARPSPPGELDGLLGLLGGQSGPRAGGGSSGPGHDADRQADEPQAHEGRAGSISACRSSRFPRWSRTSIASRPLCGHPRPGGDLRASRMTPAAVARTESSPLTASTTAIDRSRLTDVEIGFENLGDPMPAFFEMSPAGVVDGQVLRLQDLGDPAGDFLQGASRARRGRRRAPSYFHPARRRRSRTMSPLASQSCCR